MPFGLWWLAVMVGLWVAFRIHVYEVSREERLFRRLEAEYRRG